MGQRRVNVAMYGYGGPEHKGGTYLADSIMILSIDPKTNTTTMIPIPRDLWIQGLPEIPDNAKINEAFADGYVRGGVQAGGTPLSPYQGHRAAHRALDGARLRRVQGNGRPCRRRHRR